MKEVGKLQREFPNDFINIQNGSPEPGAMPKEALEENWKQRSACTAGRNVMMICADGKVIPCEQMAENEDNYCGDLKKQSIADVWNSKELDDRTVHLPVEKFVDTPCYDCDERHECHTVMGYCIRDSSQYYGTIYSPAMNCPKSNLPYTRLV